MLNRQRCAAPRHLIFALLLAALSLRAAVAEEVTIVVDRPLPTPARIALDALDASLKARGDTTRRTSSTNDGKAPTLVVGLVGNSLEVTHALPRDHEVSLEPESFAIVDYFAKRGQTGLVIAGRDAQGLAYALRDIARKVETSEVNKRLSNLSTPIFASPFLRVRAVSVHLFNADVERAWYYSEEFWRDYFARLMLCRFNQVTLTFSDQTNYLCPLYPYLVDMPEYPSVRAADCTPEDRIRNRAMLQKISNLARDYGLDFNLGIWMQAPVPRYSAPVTVAGLPEGTDLANYCALGLKRILEACPAISGVQLRMNVEAGVAEDQQTAFYKPMFDAVAQVGRTIRFDLRYKGLLSETIRAARDTGHDVTVSTKFWSEHFGMPYHPTAVDSHWSKDRYSFGTMIEKPRDYRVVYQLWNVGSQRLTLWGDPHYAGKFAESCKLGGGEGFEVFAPLTDKGYGNKPGAWSIFRDQALLVGRWEQDRYWAFYQCFGRAGYDPLDEADISREMQSRFGSIPGCFAADTLAEASRVLPLITAARLPGASEWSWWPEMDTGGSLREYMYIQPSDPAQIYAIRQWQRTPGWRWEEWDAGPGFVDDALRGQLRGKTTPIVVAGQLLELAQQIETTWKRARENAVTYRTDTSSAEWRTTETDVLLLASLARFHAAKLRAATHLAFFELADQPGRLTAALAHQEQAVEAWKRIVELTGPVYHDDLVFGVSRDSPRSKEGHHHTGHWRERLAEVEADSVWLKQLIAQTPDSDDGFEPFPAERAQGPTFKFQHKPPQSLKPDRDFLLRVGVEADAPPRRVILHHRALDQTRAWRELPMSSTDGKSWSATIAADQIDRRFDLQYYFETLDDHGGVQWPHWLQTTPYFVVPVSE